MAERKPLAQPVPSGQKGWKHKFYCDNDNDGNGDDDDDGDDDDGNNDISPSFQNGVILMICW